MEKRPDLKYDLNVEVHSVSLFLVFMLRPKDLGQGSTHLSPENTAPRTSSQSVSAVSMPVSES